MTEQKAESAQGLDERDMRVVTCAAELFLERGLEDVTMVDIAKAAHVGVATVYRHFSTKSRIAVEAATVLWERFNERILQLVESDKFLALNGLERLRMLLDGYCEAYDSQAGFVSFLDEFDHKVLAGDMASSELAKYGEKIDSFYMIFEDAYVLGRGDGSICREVPFRSFYLALTHALMGVAQKLRRGEIIPSDDFSSGVEELRMIVNMALWSLVSTASVPTPVGLPAGKEG
jgi:AcrR family transcriptional regulator